MNTRKISLIINLILIILEIVGFILVINEIGIKTLEYYTEDSNFLLLLSSALFLIYLCLDREFPSWLKTLRYISVVSTTLTLIIVLTVLSWTTDFGLPYLLFEGSMLYHHTLCPVIALISFIFVERYENLNVSYGLIFTLIYGIIMIILNILKTVEGPYPFLLVYKQPVSHSIIWTIIIFAITYLIAWILKKSNEKVII
jgi:hypothetical protein